MTLNVTFELLSGRHPKAIFDSFLSHFIIAAKIITNFLFKNKFLRQLQGVTLRLKSYDCIIYFDVTFKLKPVSV